MKRLILMRHAKSDWTNLMASDHERTLNARGRQSADAIGNWLKTQGNLPEHVLCSDAARTRETLALLNLAADIPVSLSHALYLAEPDVMAGLLHNRPEDCILMIAHNPGSAILAVMLVQSFPNHPDFTKYPTCATLVVDFAIDSWKALRMGEGIVQTFIVPRDLIA